MNISALSAAPLRRAALAIRACGRSFLRASAAMIGRVSGTSPRARRDGLRQSAQDSALANLRATLDRKRLLMIEREILIAELARAKRLHRATSGFDRRLKAVTHELMSIG